jgi:hypothetical protein
MTTFGQSYKEMSHSGAEGRFLDIKDPTERFEFYFMQIDFITDNRKRYLLGLVQNYITKYGIINPYAFAIGYIAVEPDLSITKQSLERGYTYLAGVNHYEEPLSKLIDKTDILRYARMYVRIEKSAIDDGKNYQEDQEVEEGYEEEYDYEEEEDYNDFE